jgi:superoxide dismutase, Fe-Mn family
MTLILPPLPYELNALDPFVSKEQMDYHYNKHHAAYYSKLNGLLKSDREEVSLEEIILKQSGALFNNAAQAWNHTFFWNCMTPLGEKAKPKGTLLKAINTQFGSLDAFFKQFSVAATTLFGSGWAWLATDKEGNLEIMPLSNADTPLRYHKVPVLTLDVWEHAYYIDYRNERPRFIDQFKEVINWDFAEQCYQERSKELFI